MYNDFHKFVAPKTEKKTFSIKRLCGVDALNPDETLSLGYAKYMCNLNVFNGRLSGCFGVDVARINNRLVPAGGALGKLVLNADVYRKHDYTSDEQKDRVVMLLSDNKVYDAEVGTSTTLHYTGITVVNTRVNFLNYHYDDKDCLIVFDSDGGIHIYDGNNSVSIYDMPEFCSVCVHKGKIYGGINSGSNKISVTARNNPLEWTGNIEFSDEGGAIRKIIESGDDLFIIRDFSVYKLTAYEDIDRYTITKVFSGNRRIFGETAADVDGKLIFLAEDGFYRYNGKSFERIWKELFPMIQSAEYSAAIGYGGKYYLTARFVTEGSYVGESDCIRNNGIIAISPISGEVGFGLGADVSNFFRCNYGSSSYLLMCNSPGVRMMNISMITSDGKIYGHSVKKIWRSPITPLDYIKEDKILKKFYIKTNVSLTLTITLDGEYVYRLAPSPQIQCVVVNGRAENIAVKMETYDEQPSICGFTLELELTDRRNYGGY